MDQERKPYYLYLLHLVINSNNMVKSRSIRKQCKYKQDILKKMVAMRDVSKCLGKHS